MEGHFNEALLNGNFPSQQHERKLELKLKDLETQLKARNMELEKLKEKSGQNITEHNDVNESLKTRSEDLMKVNSTSKGETSFLLELKGELRDLKVAEKNIQLEIQALNSQVNDEQRKHLQMEDLLNVRGEFITSLQDSEQVLKARLILQVKELDDLRTKLEKFKKFKAATNEDLQNLKNTISNQNYELENLRRNLKDKQENLQKLKEKFNCFVSD